MRRRIATVALLLWCCCPGAARASNEDDFFVGGRAAMTGGAVTALVADGSATCCNPAGLARAPGHSIDVSASAYALRLYHAPNLLQSVSGETSGTSVTEFVSIPTEIVYVRALTDGIQLGLGYFVPKAQDLVLRERVGVAAQGQAPAEDWSFDARDSETSYWLMAGLGAQVTERLSVGVSLNGVYDNTVASSAFFGGVTRADVQSRAFQITSADNHLPLARPSSPHRPADHRHPRQPPGPRAGPPHR